MSRIVAKALCSGEGLIVESCCCARRHLSIRSGTKRIPLLENLVKNILCLPRVLVAAGRLCWPTILDSQQETSSAIPSAAFAQRGAHFLLFAPFTQSCFSWETPLLCPSKFIQVSEHVAPLLRIPVTARQGRDRSVTSSVTTLSRSYSQTGCNSNLLKSYPFQSFTGATISQGLRQSRAQARYAHTHRTYVSCTPSSNWTWRFPPSSSPTIFIRRRAPQTWEMTHPPYPLVQPTALIQELIVPALPGRPPTALVLASEP